MNHFIAALPAIISGCAVAILAFTARYVVKQLAGFRAEHVANNQVAMEHGPLKAAVEEIQANGATKADIESLHGAIADIKQTVEVMKGTDLDQIRNSIIRICNEAIEQGWIDSYQLRSLCNLHERYKELGGNGYVDEMVSHAKSLPVMNTRKGRKRGLIRRLFGN